MPPRPAPVRIALVGAGAMGSLHARVVSQSQDAELALVVDPDADSGSALAERWRTEWQPDLDDLSDVDAVIVAAPTRTHRAWGTRALDAGRPALVEKPLSDSLEDAAALVDIARRRDVPLTCGLLERFNPAVLTALDIVDEPVHLNAVRHSPYAPRITSGVASDLLIHDVDLALRVGGAEPIALRAHFSWCHPKSAPDAEDIAEVTLEFREGLLASLSASRVSQRKVRTLVIAELERMVEVDLVRSDITVYRHVLNSAFDDDGRGYRQQTIIDIPALQHVREPLAAQLDHFVGLVRGEVDKDAELASLLPPHRVVDQAMRVAAS